MSSLTDEPMDVDEQSAWNAGEENSSPPCEKNVEEVQYAKNAPYVPMSVKEVSLVQSLKYWTNCKVRVVGKCICKPDKYYLQCFDRDVRVVLLDLNNLDQYPLSGDVVEVFGVLCEQRRFSNHTSPAETSVGIRLKIMFFKKMEMSDVPLYIKSIKIVKPYIPSFVRRDVT